MTQRIHFTKMHGAGNDYIYVNTILYNIPDPAAASIEWSKPHFGVGSDGLILIGQPTRDDADFSMRIFNNDGSEAMMCGNGTRCVAKYVYEKGLTTKTVIRLETLSGIKVLHLHVTDGKVNTVTVDMGEPVLENAKQFTGAAPTTLSLKDCGLEHGTFVSMGNPHFVTFVKSIADVDIVKLGRVLEFDPVFPERCNIEFVEKQSDGSLRTRVWERGSGVTMACGTGACATLVAAAKNGITGRSAKVVMDGGVLEIEWRDDNHLYMTGPAAIAFEGEIQLPE